MKNLAVALFSLGVILGACKSPKVATAPEPNVKSNYNEMVYSDSLFFHMEKSPCYGKCPVYSVDIYSNGKIIFVGRAFTELEGTYRGQASEEFLKEILNYANRINYFAMETKYDNENVTDLPSTVTHIYLKSTDHGIYNRYEGPAELTAFENFVHEELMELDGWEKISGPKAQ